ncbi:unnamed protein product [Vicia faba]|uniref:Uncharacterized protein n=1 Tax=Vicia faba TaxID=3906 RepID=A0AAV1B0M1_VICFA|nr:unnamed protein product [Vicia faba]
MPRVWNSCRNRYRRVVLEKLCECSVVVESRTKFESVNEDGGGSRSVYWSMRDNIDLDLFDYAEWSRVNTSRLTEMVDWFMFMKVLYLVEVSEVNLNGYMAAGRILLNSYELCEMELAKLGEARR